MAKLYRKDFQAIANEFKKIQIEIELDDFDEGFNRGVSRSVKTVADFLCTTNAEFKRQQFLDACGVK